jgi:hypothetical protein
MGVGVLDVPPQGGHLDHRHRRCQRGEHRKPAPPRPLQCSPDQLGIGIAADQHPVEVEQHH